MNETTATTTIRRAVKRTLSVAATVGAVTSAMLLLPGTGFASPCPGMEEGSDSGTSRGGTTLVIESEGLGSPVSAGPFGDDIIRDLRRAPRPPAGNDYIGGVKVADGLNSLGRAGAP